MSILTRARAGAVDPDELSRPASPEQELRRLSDLSKQVASLSSHLKAAMPDYQYSEPITFGGLTTGQHAAFALQSEFSTPSQYCVLLATFQGAGALAVGQDATLIAPALTSVLDPSARTRAQIFAAAAATTIPGTDYWADLPGSGVIYLAVNVTTNAGYVTVQFRRRVSHSGIYDEGHV